MSLKLFPAVEYLGALINLATRIWLMAAPRLNLVVTSVLVSLPVIFASKSLGAGGESATVGTSVTLVVLPIHSLEKGSRVWTRSFFTSSRTALPSSYDTGRTQSASSWFQGRYLHS